MSNIRDTVAELFHYYNVTRRVGHTTLALEGVNTIHPKGFLIVPKRRADIPRSRELKELRGWRSPIVLDNHFVLELMIGVEHEFSRLDHALCIQHARAESLQRRVDKLEAQLAKAQAKKKRTKS